MNETKNQVGGNDVDLRLLVLGGLLATISVAIAILLADLGGNQIGDEGIEPVVMLEPPRAAGQEALVVGVIEGQLAPDFEISDFDGNRYRLSDFRGRAVYLTFWATWCLPCTTGRIPNEGGLLPDLHVLSQQHGDELAIIAVNRNESPGHVQSYLSRLPRADGAKGVSFTVNAIDPDDDLYREYDGLGMPAAFFIDATGVVRQVHDRRIDLTVMEEAVAKTLAAAP